MEQIRPTSAQRAIGQQLLPDSSTLIAHSPNMKAVLEIVEKVAKFPSTVLLVGESGVGKEMIAKQIHLKGSRRAKPFIKVNCGAIPENLLESELFGYKRGAFTGADPNGKIGYFPLANEGILFLDEVTEMPLTLQVKLLRVLQEREVLPLGSVEPIKLDIQIIAATNKNIERLIQEGKFREDLYYRLNVVPIHIPPLRERKQDIPYLIEHFLQKLRDRYGHTVVFTEEAVRLCQSYSWPGNIRELENVVERIVVTCDKESVDPQFIKSFLQKEQNEDTRLPIVHHLIPLQEAVESVEEQLIIMAMKQFHSVNMAAKVLGLSQPTMSRKYQRVREKRKQQDLALRKYDERYRILENELDKQLRSVSIVMAASLPIDKIKRLQQCISAENPSFLELQRHLTMIREQEGEIEWSYIWQQMPDGRIINLVADKKLQISPGEEYPAPPDMMQALNEAMSGKVAVTPKYFDIYGEWKSSIAPIRDETDTIIAMLGVDFSGQYIDDQIEKLGKYLTK